MTTLRNTQSLCPDCLRRIDAVYERPEAEPDTVYLRKSCPEHGEFISPVWRGGAFESSFHAGTKTPDFAAWTRPKSPSYPAHPATQGTHGCPFDCGLCPQHGQHTCTGLVEVTQACNMCCPVCYAGAGGTSTSDAARTHPSLQTIAAQFTALYAASGPCNVQISGGEPTVRDDLPAIVTRARQQGFGLVQLNTNGLRLGREAGYAQQLKDAGLDSVFLQWDGVREETFVALRGQACLAVKHAAVRACAAAGLGVVLVATLVQGINDAEVGELLHLALALGPAVRGLHMQPVSSFGRFPWELHHAPRLTLPEIMHALEMQSKGTVRAQDFHPPSCEHELCSFSAVYRRIAAEDGTLSLALLASTAPCCGAGSGRAAHHETPAASEGARKSKAFVALHHRAPPIQPMKAHGQSNPSTQGGDFDTFIAQAGIQQHFTVSAMAFQDAFTLDVARVRACCIHVVTAQGTLIPFCLYNLTSTQGTALYRGKFYGNAQEI